MEGVRTVETKGEEEWKVVEGESCSCKDGEEEEVGGKSGTSRGSMKRSGLYRGQISFSPASTEEIEEMEKEERVSRSSVDSLMGDEGRRNSTSVSEEMTMGTILTGCGAEDERCACIREAERRRRPEVRSWVER